MVRAVKEGHFHRLHLVAGEYAVCHSRLETFLDRRDKFLWNVTAFNLIIELQTIDTRIGRSDFDDDVGELTTTAGLLLEELAVLYSSGDSLFVVDLRSTLIDFDVELTAESVDNNVKVKLTHTADHSLTGFMV